ncbi:MAG: hypothetical protein LAP85_08435 [Acidobacteriia bacterium]|nr:hypothetical protein [Terriglobia bacterium]
MTVRRTRWRRDRPAARGEAHVKYLNEVPGAKHAIFIVPECGHNDRCMYTTYKVVPYLFPGVAEVK